MMMIATLNLMLLVGNLLIVAFVLQRSRKKSCACLWFLRVCTVNFVIVYCAFANMIYAENLANSASVFAANFAVFTLLAGFAALIFKQMKANRKASFGDRLNRIFNGARL